MALKLKDEDSGSNYVTPPPAPPKPKAVQGLIDWLNGAGPAPKTGTATLGTGTKTAASKVDSKTVNDEKARVLASLLASQGKAPNGSPLGSDTSNALAPETGGGGNGGGGGGGGGGSSATSGGSASGTTPSANSGRRLYTAQELADMFGFTFGQGEIEAILNQATNAKFNELDAQTAQLRDRALTDYSSAYKQYNDQNRQNRSRAMKNGLSRGSNIAQEVMSQVQAQQGGSFNQQQYQQELGNLTNMRGSQLAMDKSTALNTQNQLAGQLGTMAVNQYSNNVQEDAAYMAYLGQMAQAEAQRAVAGATTQSAGIYAAAQNNATNAAATQQGNLAKTLVDSGRLDQYHASLVSYGLLTPQEAESSYQKTLAKSNTAVNPVYKYSKATQ